MMGGWENIEDVSFLRRGGMCGCHLTRLGKSGVTVYICRCVDEGCSLANEHACWAATDLQFSLTPGSTGSLARTYVVPALQPLW